MCMAMSVQDHRTSEGALACCERSVCFGVVHLACTRITQTETQRKRNVRRYQ